VRRWLVVLTLVAALAGCSGDDDKARDAAATAPAPAQTVTETVERDAPAAKAEKEKKDKAGKEQPDGKQQPVEKKQPTAPATGSQPKESPGKVPAGQVQATNGSPPEVTLAVIDAESAYVKKSAVARYAGLFDRLEADCAEARTQLAESALTASHDVESQTDAQLSILAVLREVAGDNPSGQCSPAFQRVAQRHGAS
jgi:hypothetical protein